MPPHAPWTVLALLAICTSTRLLSAAEVAVETMAAGLANPRGVAVRPGGTPERYEVYVSDAGASRVVKFRSDRPQDVVEAIAGFVAEDDSQGSAAGPRGLWFLTKDLLVVATGQADGEVLGPVRLYDISTADGPAAAGEPRQDVGPDEGAISEDVLSDGFFHVARTIANDLVSDSLVLPTRGRDSLTIWRVPIRADTLSGAVPLAIERADDRDAPPPAIAVGPHGFVLLGQSGAASGGKQSLLKFFNPLDGSVALELPVELPNVAALAYSPRTGNLYAASFPAGDLAGGGIYRIDRPAQPSGATCQAVLVARVPAPTAMGFGPDGALYVTGVKPTESGAGVGGGKNGLLAKIVGEL